MCIPIIKELPLVADLKKARSIVVNFMHIRDYGE